MQACKFEQLSYLGQCIESALFLVSAQETVDGPPCDNQD